MFTRALHWSIPWARWIQSIPPHPIFPKSILILSANPCLGLSNGHFHSGFPTKALYAFLFFSMRATFSAHLTLLDLIYVFPVKLCVHFSCPMHLKHY
jgi:hypothetical protein